MRDSLQLAPGTVVAGQFRVERPLAEGGMGAVYAAEQLGTGHVRALKVMHVHVARSAKARERFVQEAQVGARIASEHVVQVVAAGVDGELPWIAMELLRGQTLAQYVEQRGPRPAHEVLGIFRQLAHALGAAHRVGIVHRDLKPENVFLAMTLRSDAAFMVKVLDFGIAKWLQDARTASANSEALGSPYWMAPEQADVDSQIRPATDVWAMGLLAFYLLTGKIYWATAHAANASLRHLLAEVLFSPLEPAPVRAATYGCAHLIPAGFDAWFAQCVSRNEALRLRSADAAMAALTDVLATSQVLPSVSANAGAGAAAAPRSGNAATVQGEPAGAPFGPRIAPTAPAAAPIRPGARSTPAGTADRAQPKRSDVPRTRDGRRRARAGRRGRHPLVWTVFAIALVAAAVTGIASFRASGTLTTLASSVPASTPRTPASVPEAPPAVPSDIASSNEAPLDTNVEASTLMRSWESALVGARGGAPLGPYYVDPARFRSFHVPRSAAQIEQYWRGFFDANATLSFDWSRSTWSVEAPTADARVVQYCNQLEGATGPVIRVRARAREYTPVRAAEIGCATIEGVYLLRLRRVARGLRICAENWSMAEGICTSCPSAPACRRQ